MKQSRVYICFPSLLNPSLTSLPTPSLLLKPQGTLLVQPRVTSPMTKDVCVDCGQGAPRMELWDTDSLGGQEGEKGSARETERAQPGREEDDRECLMF